jgi:uncharacterized membrane protein YbhN (UPF0104 family)
MKALRRGAGLALLLVAGAYLVGIVDDEDLSRTARSAVGDPVALTLVLLTYATAFALRAWSWRRVVPALPLGQAWAAIHVSLLGNHVLPLRLGEALRVTSVVRRTSLAPSVALASTVAMRSADLLAVLVLAVVAAPRLVDDLVGPWVWAVAAVLAGAAVIAGVILRSQRASGVRLPGPAVALVALVAWCLESAVMWQAARWASIDLSAADAVAVTAATIAAQTVAITPGGIGSYEAAATAALTLLGARSGPALAAAVAAHAVKTAYSLVVGTVALFRPAPGYFGRLRLGAAPARAAAPAPAPGAPVVLFLPAHDEEESVGAVVARAPSHVRSHPVHVVVVDDGSSDQTGAVAEAAGADVIRLPRNVGLGAAVRRGLAEGAARGAAAVAFCDADGEYAPEELAVVLAPVLDGKADYVVGSRFTGTIRHMHPHRRLGNVVLTRGLRIVARRPLTDGQSGYRAFSAEAAAAAEVVHDYNYAQVLTLDLLAKGFRYAEVPISYSFRETGTSFVRLGRYLRRVVPAVHRELNASVLDDVVGEAVQRGGPRGTVDAAVAP